MALELRDFTINKYACGCWRISLSPYVHVCSYHEANPPELVYYRENIALPTNVKVLKVVE